MSGLLWNNKQETVEVVVQCAVKPSPAYKSESDDSKERQMPELTWIGKDKVVTHHNDVSFRMLERTYSFDAINGVQTEDNGSENMIIHGDNLEALKALLPKYEGKIDCACCDSPYNTGNEAWVYNDNVNDPHIKKWLGEVVGKEGEDLSRHDKWLCMMYPRLKLIQKLLSKDGALVMCIGYQELSVLQIVLSEIFPTKQVVVITVKTTGGSKPTAGFSFTQDYLIFVVPKEFVPNKSKIMQSKTATAYHGMCLAGFNQVERPNQAYPIYIDIHGKLVGVGKTLQEKINDGEYTGQKEDYIFDYEEAPAGCVAVWPITTKGDACVWRLAPESFIKNYEKGYIKIFPAKDQRNKNKYVIQYLSDGIIKRIESGELKTHRASDVVPTIEVDGFSNSGESIPAIWDDNRFYTVHGKEEMAGIFGNKDAFSYPKPTAYITEILSRITDENSVVLDAFAGSGTVAHAVLELNKEDGGNRKFVIIELCDYAETVTAERVKRAIKGYDLPKTIRIYDEEISIKNIHLGEELLEQAAMAYEEAKEIYEKVYKPRVDAGHLMVLKDTKN